MRVTSYGSKFTCLIATLGVLAGTQIGCSELKKVDEMKDNTSEMNRTTKDLKNEMGGVKDELNKVSGATKDNLVPGIDAVVAGTEELRDSLRQREALGARRDALKDLMESTELKAALTHAVHYVMSFEFQLLGGVGPDVKPETREVLYEQAMKEFVLKLDEFAPKYYAVVPPLKPMASQRAIAFNAIAFALHHVNRKQYADPKFGKPASLYDLIIHALKTKPLIDRGEAQASPYMKHVLGLGRSGRLQQLLQTRYNMFTYGLVGLTTSLTDQFLLHQPFTIAAGISIDLSEKANGRGELAELNEYVLEPAAQTTRDMVEIGLKPELHWVTKVIRSRLEIAPVVNSNTKMRLTELETTVIGNWSQYSKPPLVK